MTDADFVLIKAVSVASFIDEEFHKRVKDIFEKFKAGQLCAVKAREHLEFMLIMREIELERKRIK